MTSPNINAPLIASKEVLAIPIHECGESLIDLKSTQSICVVDEPDHPDKRADYSFVRKTVAEKLQLAQSLLPQGYYLRLFEGLRNPQLQQREFEEQLNRLRQLRPNLQYAELFQETTRLVSPIKNLDGSTNVAPHATGAAVDVDIVDQDGTALDFGMQIKDWGAVRPEFCATHCHTITPQAHRHRILLLDAMTAAGFVNYATEWWHFSYGDRYWAYQRAQPAAIYGLVTAELTGNNRSAVKAGAD